jgi:hypothetical protein
MKVKKKASKYNEKLIVNGSFDDIINASVKGNPKPKGKKKKSK